MISLTKLFLYSKKGFFRFDGQIFKGEEVKKKVWFGLFGSLVGWQGYVFDKSTNGWKLVSEEIFREAAEKGINIKELPEEIQRLLDKKH